jgi:hypothetical protein
MRSMAGRGDDGAAGQEIENARLGFRVPHVEARAPTSVLRTATSPAIAVEDDDTARPALPPLRGMISCVHASVPLGNGLSLRSFVA